MSQALGEKHRRRIVRRARKLVAECDQTIHDLELLAKTKPRVGHIDLHQFDAARSYAIGVLRQLGEARA